MLAPPCLSVQLHYTCRSRRAGNAFHPPPGIVRGGCTSPFSRCLLITLLVMVRNPLLELRRLTPFFVLVCLYRGLAFLAYVSEFSFLSFAFWILFVPGFCFLKFLLWIISCSYILFPRVYLQGRFLSFFPSGVVYLFLFLQLSVHVSGCFCPAVCFFPGDLTSQPKHKATTWRVAGHGLLSKPKDTKSLSFLWESHLHKQTHVHRILSPFHRRRRFGISSPRLDHND